MIDREKGTYTKFFCEPKGNHTIFKHNKNFYYFNIKSNKIKELLKLNKDIGLESIGWDDKSTEATTNVHLLFLICLFVCFNYMHQFFSFDFQLVI